MAFFRIFFPVSGVEISVLLPPLVAFVISFFLHGGHYRCFPYPAVYAGRQDGLLLALAITIGTLPGGLVGYYVRVRFLPDPRAFKLFVAWFYSILDFW